MSVSTLHVLTRGRAPEHDYQWVAVEPAPHPPRRERPPRLDARAAQLVQSDSPSLLVLRVGGELVLFVTALESHRTDVQGRAIRTSLALTTDAREQDTLRGLAALVLSPGGRETLAGLVDETIEDAPDGGYDVSAELLDRLFAETLDRPEASPELERRFAPNDAEHREALAEELAQVHLPAGEGPLVVVTGALGAERLEASGAWRGLSRLITEPFSRPPLEVRPPAKKGRAAARRRGTILLAAALALILLLSLILPEILP